VDLPRRALEQVRAADDLLDALRRIVDDDREVVGRRAVVAPHHQVVDHALARAEEPVLEAHELTRGAQAQRRRAPGRLALGALGGRQLAAGAGVGALGQWSVRRRRRLADLPPRAEARVQQTLGVEPGDRVGVLLEPLGLAGDGWIPVQADRRQVGELLLGVALAHAAGVEILDAHQELRSGGAGEQPREQRRAQVAEVQRAGGRGGVPTLHAGHGSLGALDER
jgi:hypothetical protein